MASLTDELATVEAEIARLEAVRDWLRTRTNGSKPAVQKRRRRRKAGSVTIADAAEKALREAGTPMRTRDMLDAVRRNGATCKDVEGLYKTLARSKERFKKAGKGEWTLAG